MIQAPPARSLLAEGEWPILLGAAIVLLAAAALMSLWLSRAYSPTAKLIWTALVLLLPLFGPLAWFVLGRERRRRE